jgi:hypothetical protein
MTDRNSFTVRPGDFDERPYSSPIPSQDGVSPRSREPLSELPGISPKLRRTHDGNTARYATRAAARSRRRQGGRGQAVARTPGVDLLTFRPLRGALLLSPGRAVSTAVPTPNGCMGIGERGCAPQTFGQRQTYGGSVSAGRSR